MISLGLAPLVLEPPLVGIAAPEEEEDGEEVEGEGGGMVRERRREADAR